MTKRRPVSLEALADRQPLDNFAAEERAPSTPAPKVTKTIEKATVYLPRAAAKRLKLMALEHDKRVNDFLREGVDLMLAKYGQPSLKEFEDQ